MPYSSSLSDAEWSIFEPMLPKKKQTRPPKWSKREIFDGILYQLKSGRSWGDTLRPAALFNALLALQAMARRRGLRSVDA
jgi:hypothetical protein